MTSRFIAFLTCFLSVGFVAAQDCELKSRRGVLDKQFEAIFSQNGPGSGLEPADRPAWTGADSTYSVVLPNGDSAFFFQTDTLPSHPRSTATAKLLLVQLGCEFVRLTVCHRFVIRQRRYLDRETAL